MTIQFLKYIVAVAEIGSITESAKQLHISQPSLSAAIREVEKEVGFAIFNRCHPDTQKNRCIDKTYVII